MNRLLLVIPSTKRKGFPRRRDSKIFTRKSWQTFDVVWIIPALTWMDVDKIMSVVVHKGDGMPIVSLAEELREALMKSEKACKEYPSGHLVWLNLTASGHMDDLSGHNAKKKENVKKNSVSENSTRNVFRAIENAPEVISKNVAKLPNMLNDEILSIFGFWNTCDERGVRNLSVNDY